MDLSIKDLYLSKSGDEFESDLTLRDLLSAQEKGDTPVLLSGTVNGFEFNSAVTGSTSICDWTFAVSVGGNTLSGATVLAFLQDLLSNAELGALDVSSINGANMVRQAVGNVVHHDITIARFIQLVAQTYCYGGGVLFSPEPAAETGIVGTTRIPATTAPYELDAGGKTLNLPTLPRSPCLTQRNPVMALKYFLNFGQLGALHDIPHGVVNVGSATLKAQKTYVYESNPGDQATLEVAMVSAETGVVTDHVDIAIPRAAIFSDVCISSEIRPGTNPGVDHLWVTVPGVNEFGFYLQTNKGSLCIASYKMGDSYLASVPVGGDVGFYEVQYYAGSDFKIGMHVMTHDMQAINVSTEGAVFDEPFEKQRVDMLYPVPASKNWDSAYQVLETGCPLSLVEPDLITTVRLGSSWGQYDVQVSIKTRVASVMSRLAFQTSTLARELGELCSNAHSLELLNPSSSDLYAATAAYLTKHAVYDASLAAQAQATDTYVIGDVVTALLGYIASGGTVWNVPYSMTKDEADLITITLSDGSSISVAEVIEMQDGYLEAMYVLEKARFNCAYKLNLLAAVSQFGSIAVDAVQDVANFVRNGVNTLYEQMNAALSAYRSPTLKKAIFASYESDINALSAVQSDYELAASLGISVEALQEKGLTARSIVETDESVLAIHQQIREACGFVFPVNEISSNTFKALDNFWLKSITNARSVFTGSASASGEVADSGAGVPALANPLFMAKVNTPLALRSVGLGEKVLALDHSFIRIIPTSGTESLLVWYARFDGNNDLDVIRCINAGLGDVKDFVNVVLTAVDASASFTIPEIETIYDMQTNAYREQMDAISTSVEVAALGSSLVGIGIALQAIPGLGTVIGGGLIIGGLAIDAYAVATAYTAVTTEDEAWDNIAMNKAVNLAKSVAYMGSDEFLAGTTFVLDGITYTGNTAYAAIAQCMICSLATGAVAPYGSDSVTPVCTFYHTPLMVPRYYFVEDVDDDWSYWVGALAVGLTGFAIGAAGSFTKNYLSMDKIRVQRYWPGIIAGVLINGSAIVLSAALGGVTAAVSAGITGAQGIASWFNSGDESVDYDKITYDELLATHEDLRNISLTSEEKIIDSVGRIVFF